MNRRQLIQSLSLAAAAAAGTAPAAMAAGKPLEALYVNHISYEVNDPRLLCGSPGHEGH